MSHAAIVYAVAEDQSFVDAVISRLEAFSPIAVRLQRDMPHLRAGESLIVVGIWSAAAAAAGVEDLLAGALAAHPRRTILCRLGDAPPFAPVFDPQVVVLGPATAEALLPALDSAVALARKRGSDTAENAVEKQGGSTGWIVAALLSVAAVGLGAAGLSILLTAPPKPVAATPAPSTSAATVPVAPSPNTASAPSTAAPPTDPTKLPENPFERAPPSPPPPAAAPATLTEAKDSSAPAPSAPPASPTSGPSREP